MKPIRVLIVDDHSLVRRGVRAMLDGDSRFSVIGEAATGQEALRIAEWEQPDAVLLDLELPDINGIEVCDRLVRDRPEIAILLLTAFVDRERVTAGMRAGAKGYLVKDVDSLHLPEQLMTAVQGHRALDPRATDILADCICSCSSGSQTLTAREITILRLAAEGLTNKEIAVEIHLSENTIKTHMKDILAKTGARNRVQAVLIGQERGYL